MNKNQYLLLSLILVVSFFLVKPVLAYVGVIINYNTYSTKTRQVMLTMYGPERPLTMMVSNRAEMDDTNWEPFSSQKAWTLSYGSGTKSVYVKYKDTYGVISPIFNDTIVLTVLDRMTVDFKINNGDKETSSRTVDLNLTYSEGVEGYRVSNNKDFSNSVENSVNFGIVWYLTPGTGDKTVYVQFRDANNRTTVVSKKIHYTEPARIMTEGTLLKGQTGTVYYFGTDGKIHPFTSLAIYQSWYKDFSKLTYVSNAKLKQYAVGKPVCIRQGTWLLKFKGLPKIYAPEPSCYLRPLMSESEAYLLYGANWQKKVIELDSFEDANYKVRRLVELPNTSSSTRDMDHDGVPLTVEEDSGSDDTSSDTDSDGLSDYEEIYYWYSDPTDPDTNDNKIKDGDEVKKNYSPIGLDKITFLPKGSYEYPRGSVIHSKTDNKYYYRNSAGKFCSLGGNPNPVLDSNSFSSQFIVESPFEIKFTADSKCRVSNNEVELRSPNI